nr:uncharacterized protein LOC111507211 [Leptinotarsa decemlineata]
MAEEVISNRKEGLIYFMLRYNLSSIGSMVLSACKENNPEIANEVENDAMEVLKCLSAKKEKPNYKTLIECSKDIANKTEKCLNEKYLPKFLLDFAKVKYEAGDLAINSDTKACSEVLNTGVHDEEIRNCVAKYDNGGIPASKAELCELIIPAAKCVTDALKNHCENNPSTTEIYNKATKTFSNLCKSEN